LDLEHFFQKPFGLVDSFTGRRNELLFLRNEIVRKEILVLIALNSAQILADFYVGTVRDFIIDESERVSYDLLQDQIVTRDIYTLVPSEIER
ncbi:MAG: hypothetical protein C0508_06055, partial [Cyanobacteria bacterium PR.023]|nr:hypothetical protein [Cyanobacteria bacterium PR.023]